MTKNNVLIALVLLPAFFVLHNYNELAGFLPFRTALLSALLIYGILAVIFFILLYRGVSKPAASLILFGISLFLLFYTPLHELLQRITFNSFLGSNWIFILLSIGLLYWLIRKTKGRKEISSKIVLFLNIALACLVLTELITINSNRAKIARTHNLIYPGHPLTDHYVSRGVPDSSKPDIYFLLFDEYTNNRTLKKVWNFDNDSITSWLTARHFYMPSDTRCNYNFTVFSLSSMFNMNYIDEKKGGDGTVILNDLEANQSMSENETFSILEKEHYSIQFLAPFRNSIEEKGLGHFFDYLIDRQMTMQTLPGMAYERIRQAWQAGTLPGLHNEGANHSLQEKYRLIRQTAEDIKNTVDSATNRQPHFVYGHFMVTHVPYVFDNDGKVMSQQEAVTYDPFSTYIEQVRLANQLIEELVTYIQTHNKRNTIILIAGDHGFRHFPSNLMPVYSFSNFNAIYLPDSDYTRLNDRLSPVNSFRIIFDQFFGQQLPLLKDSCINVLDN